MDYFISKPWCKLNRTNVLLTFVLILLCTNWTEGQEQNETIYATNINPNQRSVMTYFSDINWLPLFNGNRTSITQNTSSLDYEQTTERFRSLLDDKFEDKGVKTYGNRKSESQLEITGNSSKRRDEGGGFENSSLVDKAGMSSNTTQHEHRHGDGKRLSSGEEEFRPSSLEDEDYVGMGYASHEDLQYDFSVEEGNRKKRRRRKKKFKKKHLKKFLKTMVLPLLLAYKLKFVALVPILVSALVLVAGSTGLAGFFFALFTAAVSQNKW